MANITMVFEERLGRLRRRLEDFLPATSAVKITIGFHSDNGRDAYFRKQGEYFDAVLPNADHFSSDAGFDHYMAYLPVLVYVASRVRHRNEMVADVHDGAEADGRLTFSSNAPRAVLVPDPTFFNTGGYASARIAPRKVRWAYRDQRMLWRGSTTGFAEKDAGPADLMKELTTQRIRFCLALRDMRGVDAKISAVVSPFDRPGDAGAFQQARICGDFVAPDIYMSRRFAFDLDGNTNAWSNLFTRLLNGCCVIKVGSPHGYRQWYYERLIPWVHYVPVRADLSDLKDQIAWCWSHAADCETIAQAGRDLALSMTFRHEMQMAVSMLDRQFSGGAIPWSNDQRPNGGG